MTDERKHADELRAAAGRMSAGRMSIRRGFWMALGEPTSFEGISMEDMTALDKARNDGYHQGRGDAAAEHLREVALAQAIAMQPPDFNAHDFAARALVFIDFLTGASDEASRKLLAEKAEKRAAKSEFADALDKWRSASLEHLLKVAELPDDEMRAAVRKLVGTMPVRREVDG